MINIIVAASDNNVIGKDNSLIWKLKSDLQRFKKLTSGNTIIMGRKTYESIGCKLPNRINIVVSKSIKNIDGCIVVDSLEKAIRKAPNNREIFIIGGAQIYKESLEKEYCDKIYLTRVHQEFKGDVYFPEITGFEKVKESFNEKNNENEYDFSYIDYIKN